MIQLGIRGETITGYDDETGSLFTAGRLVEGVHSCVECVHFANSETEFRDHLQTHR